jgi:hypothetical protein
LRRVRHHPPHERNHAGQILIQQRRNKRRQDLLDAGMGAGRLQHFEAPPVDRLDSARDHGVDQTFLGLEMIVYGGEIDLRLGGDVAQGSRLETIQSKQLFSGIEDARLSVRLLIHTYVSIVRLI